MLLVGAVVATPIILAWGARQAKKADALATRGVTTNGRIEHVGVLTKHGNAPMKVSYVAGGKPMTVKVDLPLDYFAEGQAVTVVYDPQRPRDCDVRA